MSEWNDFGIDSLEKMESVETSDTEEIDEDFIKYLET